jgi:GH25 family lysozyme M1 (1,4-beta-N-acetylmuramidase)
MTRFGVDISHHQATFDADRYFAAGEAFVILKATEGAGFVDPTFRGRWQQVGARPRGAYHFARPGGSPADAQADHFIATVRAAGWTASDAWALDLEDAGGLGPASLVAWADRWCTRVRAALTGRGLFYSYLPFIRDTMGNPGRVPGGCLAWVARYRTDTPYAAPYGRPGGFPDPPDVWQCSNGEVGCVKTVTSIGRCDYNRMTDGAFQVLFGGQEDTVSAADVIDALRSAEGRQAVRAAVWGGTGTEIPSIFGTTNAAQVVEVAARGVQTLANRLNEISGDLGAKHAAVLAALAALPTAHLELSDEDLAAIAAQVDLDPAEFIAAWRADLAARPLVVAPAAESG